MQKINDLNQEIRKLSAFKPSQDRRTDTVAYRGAICNQKECPMLHWIIGKLHVKHQGPKSRDKKVISF